MNSKNDAVAVVSGRSQTGAARPETELGTLAEQIKDWHAQCKLSFTNFIGYRFLIGRALIRAKELVPHIKPGPKKQRSDAPADQNGEVRKFDPQDSPSELVPNFGTNSTTAEHEGFLSWKRRAFPGIPNQTLADYVAFAREVIKKDPRFASIDLQSVDGEERDEALRSLKAMTRGRDVTFALRAMQEIPEPQHPRHTPSKKTAKEQAAEDVMFAEQRALHLYNDINALMVEKDRATIALMSDASRTRLSDLLIDFCRVLRDFKAAGKEPRTLFQGRPHSRTR